MASSAVRSGKRCSIGYRVNIAARVLAGTVGAYLLAALAAFTGARLWPADAFDSVFAPTLLAFIVMPGATLWAFLARGPRRAWAGLLFAAALLAVLGWWVGPPA